MEDKKLDIFLGKTKCIHPNKDPKCDDCPNKLKKHESMMIKDLENIFGKTKCVHPGKDPKCDDCPDRKKNGFANYMPPSP